MLPRPVRLLLSPAYRRFERDRRDRFLWFARRHGDLLRPRTGGALPHRKTVMVVPSIFPPLIEVELFLLKALEGAGFRPVVAFTQRSALVRRYYRLAAAEEVEVWRRLSRRPALRPAEEVVAQQRSLEDVLVLEHKRIRVGMYAVSTVLRRLLAGSLDLALGPDRRGLVRQLAASIAAAEAADAIVSTVRPDLALFVDRVYTPEGELFDACVAHGVDVIACLRAHKSDAVMLKRYTAGNRAEHPASISEASWLRLREMEWTRACGERLQREFDRCYAAGDWYGAGDDARGRRRLDADAVRRRLGLDPKRRTAFVFPHVAWDESLNWGSNLFANYDEWFVETVRAACANDGVNWAVKIHPVYVHKGGVPTELALLRQHFADLPAHVVVIPADSEVSTFSLLGAMDYCLTVRGTVGIEAARLGIPVLTAGTGRYDHKGFTVDSETRQEYLARLARIQDVPRLSPAQRELAERYAYGLFILRPLELTSLHLSFREDAWRVRSDGERTVPLRNAVDLAAAADLMAFAEWAASRQSEDFMAEPVP